MVLFWAFIAEALPAVLLYYGLSWRLTRTTPASWGAHLLIIGALCVAVAGVRYASAFVVGGTFAMESTTSWSLVVPLTLSFAAAMWLRGRVGRGTHHTAAAVPVHQAVGARPPPAPPPTPTRQTSLWADGALVVMLIIMGGVAWLSIADSGKAEPPRPVAAPDAPRAIVDPFKPPRAIVDPFKAPPWEVFRALQADPDYTAALTRWESRHREWLLLPGAREAFTESVLTVHAEGTARSYDELLQIAGERAYRAQYERQRQQRTQPAAAACPPGLIPDPSFNNQCNLPEAVEANKQSAQR